MIRHITGAYLTTNPFPNNGGAGSAVLHANSGALPEHTQMASLPERTGGDFLPDGVWTDIPAGSGSADTMDYAGIDSPDFHTGVDSLGHAGADSLWMHAGDSLTFADSMRFAAEGAKENVMSSAEVVYGEVSTLAAPMRQTIAADPAPLTGNTFYDLAVLGCFIAFCLILFLYRGYAFGIFNVFRGGAATEKMLDEQSKLFGTFLSRTIIAGLLVASLTILRVGDLFIAGHLPALSALPDLPELESLAVIAAAWVGVAAIWGYQYVLLRVAGGLTFMRDFTTRLFFIKKVMFAIWTITATPLFLFFALSEGRSAEMLGMAIIAVTALMAVFMAARTFMLFIRHNFSILLWILYLCAVEIFPVSIAAILIRKFLA